LMVTPAEHIFFATGVKGVDKKYTGANYATMDTETKERHDAYIRENWATKSGSEIGASLGRTPSSIGARARRLGLKKKLVVDEIKEQGDAYIRENWPTMSATEIGSALGLSRNAIIGRAHRMGLSKARVSFASTETTVAQRLARKRSGRLRFKAMVAQKTSPDIKPTVERHVEPIAVPCTETNCTLAELTNKTCRFPIGDPRSKDFRYCGSSDGVDNPFQPYCNHHTVVAMYLPQR
jgi:GcrA cell cycle regulator